MKRILIASVAVVAMLTACTEQFGVDNSNKHSCTLPSYENGKTSWVAGDQLLIHGETSEDQKVITLTPSDISADGKTCYVSVDGVAPFEQKTVKSKYYIAYPAELVNNPSKCKESTMFSTTNGVLMAGYDKDMEFVIEPVTGGFAFTVNGDFDSYSCTGNNDECMGYSSLTSKVTPITKIFAEKRGTAKTEISGLVTGDGSTVNYLCFVEEPVFADGFMLVFYKGSTPMKTFYTEKLYKVERSKFIDLGDITSELMDYKSPNADNHTSAITDEGAVDLSAQENANCYIVTAPGKYKFKATKGTTAEALASIGSVEVLWETWGNTEKVTANSVIAAVDYEKDYVYFRVTPDRHPGNAVIAARNDMGAIMWSWHIWVPETEIKTGLYNLTRRETMDRNLGALVAANENGATPESAGFFYQWGRKDPFVGVGDFTTGEPATVSGEKMSLYGGQMSTVKTTKNPTVFADFEGNWNSVAVTDLWNSGKGVNDPCPPGYKIPYRSEYLLFTNSPEEVIGWEYMPKKNVFSVGSPQTYYPLTGYLSWDGTYNYVGTGTRVWSSRTHDTASNAYNFRLSPDDEGLDYGNSGKEKANGYAVRCVVYDATPFENKPGTPVKGKQTEIPVKVTELSGLCLSVDKDFLWGVGDQGTLARIAFDGTVTRQFGQSLDMEAVTLDPATGDLYLGCEANWVGVVKAPDYTKAVELFRVEDAEDYGNSGVEGISWYKNNHLLVGAQTGANLWCYDLEGNVLWKRSMRTVAIGQLEIADIHYDPVKDQVWIIDSETQSIYLFNGDATEHLATYKVGFGGNCESIHVDHGNNCVWIADDSESAKLFKIDFTF